MIVLMSYVYTDVTLNKLKELRAQRSSKKTLN